MRYLNLGGNNLLCIKPLLKTVLCTKITEDDRHGSWSTEAGTNVIRTAVLMHLLFCEAGGGVWLQTIIKVNGVLKRGKCNIKVRHKNNIHGELLMYRFLDDRTSAKHGDSMPIL